MPTAEDLARSKRILEGTVSASELVSYLASDCYMTQQTAAHYIDHMDSRKIEQAIRAGQLRAFRVGKKTLVKKSDVDAWIASNEVTRPQQVQKSELQNLVSIAIETARKRTA